MMFQVTKVTLGVQISSKNLQPSERERIKPGEKTYFAISREEGQLTPNLSKVNF